MKIDKLEPATGHSAQKDTSAREKGFWALDWLRFVLAVYLVLFHTLRNNYPPLEHTWLDASLGLGNMATSVFFVLSGFLLTHAYVVVKNGRALNTRNFLVARLSTLYPLHIAGLLVALVPLLFMVYTRGGISVATEVSGPAVRMLGHGEFLLALASNVALLNAWNPFYLSFNIPSWSLSALAFYYVLFPIFAPKVYRMKSPAFGLVVLGILFLVPGAIADLLHRTDIVTDGLLHRNPVIRLPLFLAGMVLCVLFARSRKTGSSLQVAALVAVVLATIAIGVDLQFREARLHMIRNGLYFPASLAIIWLCVLAAPTRHRALQYWGSRLGAASLPLFLLHGPLYSVFQKIEKLVTVVVTGSGNDFSSMLSAGRGLEQNVSIYPLYLILLVIICVMVQERFVAPLQIRIRNHLANNPLQPATLEKGEPAADKKLAS